MNRLQKALIMEYIDISKRLSELHTNIVMFGHLNETHKKNLDFSLLTKTQDKLRKRLSEIRIELNEG